MTFLAGILGTALLWGVAYFAHTPLYREGYEAGLHGLGVPVGMS